MNRKPSAQTLRDVRDGLPAPGDVLVGKYRIIRSLGHGGVGWVFEAEHVKLRQRVALKVLVPAMLEYPEMIARFEREARAMALLSSPHVTRVTDVDTTEVGLPFLVMELLHGHDLHAELKARGALSVQEAVRFVRQACAGMAVVHRAGIVHRDLKPSNLFVVDEEEARTLKIMDFGVSKVAGDLDVTMTTTTLGTPAYMAPEQVRSAKHIDGRADIWSLGVILHRMLTGQLPFRGESSTAMAVAIVTDPPEPLATLRPDLPPALVALVARTLDKDPNRRFSTVQELSEALAPFETIAAPAPVLAPPVSDGPSVAAQSLQPIAAPAKRRWLAPVIALATLGLIAGSVVVVRGRANDASEPIVEKKKAKKTEEPKVLLPEPEAPEPVPSASASTSVEAIPSVSAAPLKPKPTAAPPAATPKKPAPAPTGMPVLL